MDEDLPTDVAKLLIDRGHDTTTVTAQGWSGITDEKLRPRVQSEGRWLVTGDKGFADLRRYSPGSHAGVILLRPGEESRRSFIELTERVIDQLNLEQLSGAIIVATPAGIRIRRSATHSGQ